MVIPVFNILFAQAKPAGSVADPNSSGNNKAGVNKSGQPQGGAKVNFTGAQGSRMCPECGYQNSTKAKKCVRCKSHLQGRRCTK